MAITTVQQMIDGVQPGVHVNRSQNPAAQPTGHGITSWGSTGSGSTTNGAATWSSAINGVTLTNATPGATVGSLRLPQSSGSTVRLARHDVNAHGACLVLLCDRIWHNGGINRVLTTEQTIVSDARDDTGTANGVGVMLALESSAIAGTGAPTVTVKYTNSSDVASRTATNIVPILASSVKTRTAIFFGLDGGDVGVKSVQSIQFSASWGASGTLHLVAYRVMAVAIHKLAYNSTAQDMLACGCPLITHESVPYYMVIPSASTFIPTCTSIYTSIG